MNFALCLTLVGTLAPRDPAALIDPWMAAMNTGDPRAIRRFHDNAPWKKDAEQFTQADYLSGLRAGGFVRVRDLPPQRGRVQVLAKSKKLDEYVVLTMGPGSDGTLSPGIRFPSRAELTEVPPATEATLVPRLKAYVDALIREGKFNGSLALAKGDKILYQAHAGLAHRGFKVPNRWDTKFNLASMGKMFTAVAIGQLVDQGKLTFDSKVGEVLPDYPNAEVREKVTVRMLLSHRSGLGDMFTQAYADGSKDRWKTIDSMLPLFQSEPLQFAPGERAQYSNAGYVLLGKIIEKASSMDYWSYVKKNIFDPVGMPNTAAYELDFDTPNLAFGYTHDSFDFSILEGEPRNNIFMHIAKGSPAGGAFSTVPDLLKFASALRSGKLVKASTLAILTTPSGGFPGYGLGFQLQQVQGETGFGHSGGFPGINGEMMTYAKSGYTIVVMANYDREAMPIAVRARWFIGDLAASGQKN